MLLKLLKHEFKVNRMTYIVLFVVVMLAAIMLRIGGSGYTVFSEDTTANTITSFLVFIYGIGIAAAYIYWIATSVQSFSKSMFKKPGYLTMTLPVSTDMKILSKLCMSAFWFVVVSIVIALSFLILDFTVIEALFEAIARLDIYDILQLVTGLIMVFQNILLLYLCVTFINTKYVKGHRGLIGVGLYFVVSYVISLIQALSFGGGFFIGGLYVTYNFFFQYLLFTLVIAVISYFVIRILIDKKLELD